MPWLAERAVVVVDNGKRIVGVEVVRVPVPASIVALVWVHISIPWCWSAQHTLIKHLLSS